MDLIRARNCRFVDKEGVESQSRDETTGGRHWAWEKVASSESWARAERDWELRRKRGKEAWVERQDARGKEERGGREGIRVYLVKCSLRNKLVPPPNSFFLPGELGTRSKITSSINWNRNQTATLGNRLEPAGSVWFGQFLVPVDLHSHPYDNCCLLNFLLKQ